MRNRPCGLILLILSSACVCGNAIAAEKIEPKSVIKLWPKDAASKDAAAMGKPKPSRGDGHIRLTNITVPSMWYFPAPARKKPVPVMILCPGGGYSHLVVTKMTAIAKWLNERGVSAFVLVYRAPKKREAAYQDVQRAIRIVRSRASEWNIDPKQVGVLGSSAGGHLAARACTGSKVEAYKAVDAIDKASARPDFAALLYPAYMNKGNALSDQFKVSKESPPTLIISARDDKRHFKSGEVYAKALKEAGASIRTHFFDKGGHGFGMVVKQKPLSTWPDLFDKWLRDIGVLKTTK